MTLLMIKPRRQPRVPVWELTTLFGGNRKHKQQSLLHGSVRTAGPGFIDSDKVFNLV